MQKRFRTDQEIRMSLDEIFVTFPKKPSRIFVCSTFEIFHPLADPYRNNIFKQITLTPEHTFIILTKMPENIDRPMPDNVWLGVSVTGKNGDDHRIRMLCDGPEDRVRFVSFEPLLGDVAMKRWSVFPDYTDALSWVIVGRLTGHGHRFDPTQANIKRIYQECRKAGIPIFLKNNLREIWGRPLVQEFPMETCI
jgi:protein gp37